MVGLQTVTLHFDLKQMQWSASATAFAFTQNKTVSTVGCECVKWFRTTMQKFIDIGLFSSLVCVDENHSPS